MSKSSRRSTPVFGSTAAVLDGPETPVDEQEDPETPDTTENEPAEAPEGQSEAPEAQEPHVPTLKELQEAVARVGGHPDQAIAADPAAAVDPVIDPSAPRAAQADKLATQVNQALAVPEEIAAKLSFEAQLKSVVGEGIVNLPDGGVRATVVISPEDTEVIRAWAEGAGETFPDYLQTIMGMALQAVLNGGSVAG